MGINKVVIGGFNYIQCKRTKPQADDCRHTVTLMANEATRGPKSANDWFKLAAEAHLQITANPEDSPH